MRLDRMVDQTWRIGTRETCESVAGTDDSCASRGDRPLVAVYRSILMNFNEVYLRTEVEGLQRYRGFYVGTERVAGVELPPQRTLTLRESYRRIDGALDPIVTRVGWRAERVRALAPLGRALGAGQVVGRLSKYMFEVHGVSPRLVRTLRALRPTILHAYTGVSGAHALPLARKLGIPLVVSFGGYDATATDDELARWPQLGRVMLRRREAMKRDAALIITASEFLRQKLVQRGWPADRIVTRWRGIDTDFFSPAGAAPLRARRPIVMSAGRLIAVKGMAYLLSAMRQVQNVIPDAELLIAGDGALRAELETQARTLGIRVRFLGVLRPDQIREQLAQARVYCIPSVFVPDTGQEEGLSNALLEAMSAGLAPVGTRTGGIPDAIGHAGILVPERDPSALAAAITRLLSDSALCEQIGAASRKRIVAEFDLRRQSARLEDLYDRVRDEHARESGSSPGETQEANRWATVRMGRSLQRVGTETGV